MHYLDDGRHTASGPGGEQVGPGAVRILFWVLPSALIIWGLLAAAAFRVVGHVLERPYWAERQAAAKWRFAAMYDNSGVAK